MICRLVELCVSNWLSTIRINKPWTWCVCCGIVSAEAVFQTRSSRTVFAAEAPVEAMDADLLHTTLAGSVVKRPLHVTSNLLLHISLLQPVLTVQQPVHQPLHLHTGSHRLPSLSPLLLNSALWLVRRRSFVFYNSSPNSIYVNVLVAIVTARPQGRVPRTLWFTLMIWTWLCLVRLLKNSAAMSLYSSESFSSLMVSGTSDSRL